MSAPKLPTEVSPDGKEIWDWAAKLSRYTGLLDDSRILTRQIRDIGLRCGSCRHWMTSSCPRERQNNQTGRSEGPNMNGIKCDKFVMDHSSISLLAEWQEKLNTINAELEKSQ